MAAGYFTPGAVPDAEEPPNAPWRQGLFVPPDNATARTPPIRISDGSRVSDRKNGAA